MSEEQLSTVNPEARTMINDLSAELRGVARETPNEQPKEVQKEEAETPENKEVDAVQKTQQAQDEVDEKIDELTEEAENTADPKRKSRANDRIRELVAQKKQLEELLTNYSKYTPLIEEYEKTVQEQNKPKYTEFNTQEEFYNAVKEQAKREALDEIRKEISPIVTDSTNAKYQKQLDTWFKQNPEAVQVKNQLDEYSSQLSDDEKVFYQRQILSGNHRPLDLLYRAVKPEVNPTGAIQNAIKADQRKVGIASSKKSSKSVEENTSFDDDLNYAVKKGDFRKLITKHLLT